MSVTLNLTNNGTTVSLNLHNGRKGDAFRYEDFTPEQLAELKVPFVYEDFTPEQIEGLKLKFEDLTETHKEELKGDAFLYEDFTPEQLEALKVKGDKGDSFEFSDFTPEQLESLRGPEGKDAFEVWQQQNPEGTFEEYQASIKGDTGDMPTAEIDAYLANFYSPSIIALHRRGTDEGATFEQKLRFPQAVEDENPDASLLLTPSVIKAGKLYSVLPSDGSGDFTVERNSTATRVNKEGLIEVVAANVPRIDYSTGEPMVLVEGQSTNIYHNSVLFQAGNVAKTGSPFSVMELLHPNEPTYVFSGNNSSLQYGVGNYSLKALTTYTFSAFVRMDDKSVPKVGVGSSNDFRIVVENQTAVTHTVKHIEDDIYKVSGTKQTDETLSVNSGIYKDAGQSTKGFTCLGFHLEEGTIATSYIPTNGSIATRLADNIYNTLPESGEVTIHFADGTTQTISGTAGEIFTLPEGLIKKVEMI